MTAIRTPDQRLRIFISSTMKELAEARVAARLRPSDKRVHSLETSLQMSFRAGFGPKPGI